MSHDKIYTCNVSVVRVNGTIIPVGDPTDLTISWPFRRRILVFTSSYGHCCETLPELIRVEQRCMCHKWDLCEIF